MHKSAFALNTCSEQKKKIVVSYNVLMCYVGVNINPKMGKMVMQV